MDENASEARQRTKNGKCVVGEYLKGRGMVPVKRSISKGMFAPLIGHAFNLGLRDVIDQAIIAQQKNKASVR